MINERIEIWKKEEYHYPAAHGFIPVMFSYIHEDEKKHPAMIIAPGGAYREVSPSEAHLPAMEFYGAGYNVFVLEYTINQLDEAPLNPHDSFTCRGIPYQTRQNRSLRILSRSTSVWKPLCT